MKKFKKLEDTDAPQLILDLAGMVENTIPYAVVYYNEQSKNILVVAKALVVDGVEVRPQLNLVVGMTTPLSNQFKFDQDQILSNVFNQIVAAFRNKILALIHRSHRQ